MKSLIAKPYEAGPLADGTATALVRRIVPRMTEPKIAPLEMEPWLIDGVQETDDDGRPCWIGRHPAYPNDKWFSPDYGVGDVLAVKETWAPFNPKHPRVRIAYKAGMVSYGNANLIDADTGDCQPDTKMLPDPVYPGQVRQWRSGAQMPVWAVRTRLKVTGVSVARSHSLTHIDIERLGIPDPCGYYCDISVGHVDHQGTIHRFAELWNTTYGAGAYERNDWLFVYRVRKI